jgi:hypothetical protein
MPRKFLSIAMLALFAIAAVAQTQAPAAPANGQPFGGPILNTPNATFTTPAPEAGITDAGRAGISAGSTTETAPAANATDMTGTSTAIVSEGTAVPAEAPTNDLGVSVSVNNPEVVTPSVSVAEAAHRYKNEKAAVNARTLSNDDVEQIIKNKNGVTIASNATQSALPAASDQSQPAPQTAQPESATAQPQSAATQTTADNATTPQINENQQSNDAQGSTRLPATATFLPLIGLMGLASGGFGLWVRKFRK